MAASNGLGGVEFIHRHTKVEPGGGIGAIGVVSVISAVQKPFEKLVPAVAGSELCGKQALAQVAARGGRLVPQQQIGGKLPGEVILRGKGGIHQLLGKIFEGNVTARFVERGKDCDRACAAAVVQAGRLEQCAVLRVEQDRDGGDGRQVAGQGSPGEGRCQDGSPR